MTIFQRAGLEAIPPYKQGSPPRPAGGLEPHKLSSNESPYPPLPSVMTAVASAAGDLHRYPSIAAEQLREALALRWGVGIENIGLGAGSVEVASQLIHATTDPGDGVMFAWRSFEAYPILATVAGAIPQPIPNTADGGHDLAAMAAAITPRTRVVFLCNPNNPTGSVLTASAVDEFLRAVPRDVLVVIDEAYVHFNRHPETAVGIELFRAHPNVAVLHTFSKAYGLAGLRLGYAIGPRGLIEALGKVAVPFAVTSLAQRAGIASLEAEDELRERIDALVAERERVHAGMADAGLPVLPSGANFLWLSTGADTDAVARLFEENALSVRAFPGEGLRISLGTPDANDRVLGTARTAASLLAAHH